MHVCVQVSVAVCMCGQLGAHMCASGCGSVCLVNKVHVCVEGGVTLWLCWEVKKQEYRYKIS